MTIQSHDRLTVEPESESPAMFKLGMRRLASGVSLVTTVVDENPAGFVATSVTAVSAQPATLLVCANRDASAHDPIDRAGVFCVNLLGRGDEELASQFSSSSRREERFRTGDWEPTASGALALRSAMAWFDCAIEMRIRHHSHTIFIGRIAEIRLGAEKAPLVYFNQRYLGS